MKTNTLIVVILIAGSLATDPLTATANLNVTKTLTSAVVNLPGNSELSCNSAELDSLISDSIYSSYITADVLKVSKIIAKDSSIDLTGKITVSGSVTYKSQSDDQENVSGPTSFLQIHNQQWKEFNFYRVSNGRISVQGMPSHEFLRIEGNSHCEEGEALMRVDGYVEWMQSCEGSMHFQVVVNHDDKSAEIELFGSEKTEYVIVYFK